MFSAIFPGSSTVLRAVAELSGLVTIVGIAERYDPYMTEVRKQLHTNHPEIYQSILKSRAFFARQNLLLDHVSQQYFNRIERKYSQATTRSMHSNPSRDNIYSDKSGVIRDIAGEDAVDFFFHITNDLPEADIDMENILENSGFQEHIDEQRRKARRDRQLKKNFAKQTDDGEGKLDVETEELIKKIVPSDISHLFRWAGLAKDSDQVKADSYKQQRMRAGFVLDVLDLFAWQSHSQAELLEHYYEEQNVLHNLLIRKSADLVSPSRYLSYEVSKAATILFVYSAFSVALSEIWPVALENAEKFASHFKFHSKRGRVVSYLVIPFIATNLFLYDGPKAYLRILESVQKIEDYFSGPETTKEESSRATGKNAFGEKGKHTEVDSSFPDNIFKWPELKVPFHPLVLEPYDITAVKQNMNNKFGIRNSDDDFFTYGEGNFDVDGYKQQKTEKDGGAIGNGWLDGLDKDEHFLADSFYAGLLEGGVPYPGKVIYESPSVWRGSAPDQPMSRYQIAVDAFVKPFFALLIFHRALFPRLLTITGGKPFWAIFLTAVAQSSCMIYLDAPSQLTFAERMTKAAANTNAADNMVMDEKAARLQIPLQSESKPQYLTERANDLDLFLFENEHERIVWHSFFYQLFQSTVFCSVHFITGRFGPLLFLNSGITGALLSEDIKRSASESNILNFLQKWLIFDWFHMFAFSPTAHKAKMSLLPPLLKPLDSHISDKMFRIEFRPEFKTFVREFSEPFQTTINVEKSKSLPILNPNSNATLDSNSSDKPSSLDAEAAIKTTARTSHQVVQLDEVMYALRRSIVETRRKTKVTEQPKLSVWSDRSDLNPSSSSEANSDNSSCGALPRFAVEEFVKPPYLEHLSIFDFLMSPYASLRLPEAVVVKLVNEFKPFKGLSLEEEAIFLGYKCNTEVVIGKMTQKALDLSIAILLLKTCLPEELNCSRTMDKETTKDMVSDFLKEVQKNVFVWRNASEEEILDLVNDYYNRSLEAQRQYALYFASTKGQLLKREILLMPVTAKKSYIIEHWDDFEKRKQAFENRQLWFFTTEKGVTQSMLQSFFKPDKGRSEKFNEELQTLHKDWKLYLASEKHKQNLIELLGIQEYVSASNVKTYLQEGK